MYHSLVRHKHYSIKNNSSDFLFSEFWKKQNKTKNAHRNTTSHVCRFLNTEALRESLKWTLLYEKLSRATRRNQPTLRTHYRKDTKFCSKTWLSIFFLLLLVTSIRGIKWLIYSNITNSKSTVSFDFPIFSKITFDFFNSLVNPNLLNPNFTNFQFETSTMKLPLSENIIAHWSATVMTPLGKIQRAYIALYHILLYLR